MISIVSYFEIHLFISETQEFLNQNESINNKIISQQESLDKNSKATNKTSYFAIQIDSKIQGVGIIINNDLLLSVASEEYTDAIIDFLVEENVKLDSLLCDEKIALNFAKQYSERLSISYDLYMHLGIYECGEVVIPKEAKGFRLILVTDKNKNIARDYIQSFIVDCFPDKKDKLEKISNRLIQRHLKNNSLYLLEGANGEILSMAGKARETKSTGTISQVYTPEAHRNKGFGKIVTALVTEKILDEGKNYCNLFTNLENSTSNSLYKKIGYKLIGKNKHFLFNHNSNLPN